MNEFANKLIDRIYVLFLLLGIVLMVGMAADSITIGKFALKITNPVWRIIIGSIGFVLVCIGFFMSLKEFSKSNVTTTSLADPKITGMNHDKQPKPIDADFIQHSMFTSIQKLEAKTAFADLILQADDLFLAGVALGFAAQRHTSQLGEQVKKGCRLRFLVLDPNSCDIEPIAKAFSISPEQIRNDILITLYDLEKLKQDARGTKGLVEIRLMTTEAAFSFVIVNPNSTSTGYLSAGLRLYGYRSSTRPYFVLEAPDPWFARIVDSCEKLWKDSKVWKPITQKAGIVPYRIDTNGNLEVLLVPANKNSGRWEFPVGRVERGETLQEAAIREFTEESGYIVKIEKKDSWFLELEQEETIDQITFFPADVSGSTKNRETNRQNKWISISEFTNQINPDYMPMAHVVQRQLESDSFNQS